jgi:parallel beta-helix repeat protein
MRRHVFLSALAGAGLALLLSHPAGAATIVVNGSIQAAVDAAQDGDTISIPPGIYREHVVVTKNGLSLQASHGAVLEGSHLAPGDETGILVESPEQDGRIDGFGLSGLKVRNESGAGLILVGVDGFAVSNSGFTDTGDEGIFALGCNGGVIDKTNVSGAVRVGIELDQDASVTVSNSSVTACTVGIAAESCLNSTIRQNQVSRNSAGILTDLRPDYETSYEGAQGASITNNLVSANNRPNPFSPQGGDPLGLLPSGTGILNIGLDNVEISGNLLVLNGSFGIGVISFPQLPPTHPSGDVSDEPNFHPDNTSVHQNRLLGNGRSPDPRLQLTGLHPADLIWDGTGTGNHWSNNGRATSFPSSLP